MQTIAYLDTVPSALPTDWSTRCIGNVVRPSAKQADSNFSATLPAMAGHDLREPLQVITSAHDVLAPTRNSRLVTTRLNPISSRGEPCATPRS